MEYFYYILRVLFALIRTAFTYMAFPLFRLLINRGRFDRKKARKIALWNSIVVGAIYFVLSALSESGKAWSPVPAMLYFGINCLILTDKTLG